MGIAFITHKASMSDAIESIYLAADADPDCDAFWVPVPYYEHNEEGKPEAMHLEGQDNYTNIHPDFYCEHLQKFTDLLRTPGCVHAALYPCYTTSIT